MLPSLRQNGHTGHQLGYCPPTADGLVPFCALKLEGRALPAAVCGYSHPTLFEALTAGKCF
eukprot:1148386-Pelagomonas_calceolata.AAC.7